MPNFKGGKLERAGTDAWYTAGIGRGDYYVETENREKIPLGALDSRQVDLIKHNTLHGNWNAPAPNTQRGGK